MAGMTPLTFDILLALADEARHGYGIIKEIEARAGADAAPSTGALYLALRRMQGEGLIEESEAAPEEDARRKYYRLTSFGRKVAAAEAERMAHLVEVAFDKQLIDGELTLEENKD